MKTRGFSLHWDQHLGPNCYRIEYYDVSENWLDKSWHTFFVAALAYLFLWVVFGYKRSETDQNLDF